MSYQTLRQKFEEYKAKHGIRAVSKESLRWFYENVSLLVKRADYNQTTKFGKVTTKPIPGKFYLYKYDPKYKDVLPIYDALPLVLITSITEKGWYGINFHYLPPDVRVGILDLLFKTISDKTKSDKIKLKINWVIAQRLAKKIAAVPDMNEAYRQYLAGHMESPLLEIDPYYWTMTVFLPLSRWKKKRLPW